MRRKERPQSGRRLSAPTAPHVTDTSCTRLGMPGLQVAPETRTEKEPLEAASDIPGDVRHAWKSNSCMSVVVGYRCFSEAMSHGSGDGHSGTVKAGEVARYSTQPRRATRGNPSASAPSCAPPSGGTLHLRAGPLTTLSILPCMWWV